MEKATTKSQRRLNRATSFLEQVFDKLETSYTNIYFDSNFIVRPLSVTFEQIQVTQISLEWDLGHPLNISRLALFNEGVEVPFTVRSIENFSSSVTFSEKSYSISEKTSDLKFSKVLIYVDKVLCSKVEIEQKTTSDGSSNEFRASLIDANNRTKFIFDDVKEKKKFWHRMCLHPLFLRNFLFGKIVKAALQTVLMQQYELTRVPFGKMRRRLDQADYSSIGQIFNERWLNARNHEFGQHGASNTFRYWTEEEKLVFLQDIKSLTDALTEQGIDSIICYGSLLGPVRDGDFIPHDDDADIVCFHYPDEISSREFIENLSRIGSSVGMKILKVHKKNVFIRFLTPNDKSIDFFLCEVDTDNCNLHPAKHKPTSKETIFPIATRQIKGIDLPFPNDSETLLRNIYGAEWETPVPFFTHNWKKD